jgi:hypothetical protein
MAHDAENSVHPDCRSLRTSLIILPETFDFRDQRRTVRHVQLQTEVRSSAQWTLRNE